MSSRPHEVFADAIREAVIGGAVAVASGEMPELSITITMAQSRDPEEHDDGSSNGEIQLSVEFDPPLSRDSEEVLR